ncbi:hypothetical protein GALMADRAFT_155659 [Galerina marginata CBS 339.88]|uniref:F-box domain-containing protein n=1 Tax=Galerina marginata (strain CBS 339.88) TaxID=685588 RepID=A0A067TDD8_GALM3|nr:hypothetical protein GALMADRAFT_155659 [Galerina marginata CBS 339.88]
MNTREETILDSFLRIMMQPPARTDSQGTHRPHQHNRLASYGICRLSFKALPVLGITEDVPWDNISRALRESLTETFRSPYLTDLNLCNVCKIPRSAFSNVILREMILTTTYWSRSDQFENDRRAIIADRSSSFLQAQFKSFGTDHSYPMEYFEFEHNRVLGNPIMSSPFSDLRSLTSSVNSSNDFADCMKVFSRSANTIENIHLRFSSQIIPEIPQQLYLARFPNLRHLEISHFLPFSSDNAFELNVRSLLPLFNGPQTSAGIEESLTVSTIHFSLRWSQSRNRPRAAVLFPSGSESNWLTLDALLSSIRYSSLERVSVTLRILSGTGTQSGREALARNITYHIKRAFPSLLAKRILETKVEVH